MPGLELSVTIASWNTKRDLDQCLKSLWEIRDEVPFEVIVVDNGSSDGSADLVAEKFPWVRLERMRLNLGFTGGHNHALAIRAGRNALLLNSDTVVHPGALKHLLEFSKEHPDAGILGPKLLNPDGSLQYSCRHFPNPMAALFRNTPLGRLFPNNRFTRDYLMTDWAHNEPREVDWVSGAAMFVTEKALSEVGLLDPHYFMYCEDVDWCWRVWKAGLKVMYVPGAQITHAIGRSTDQVAKRMLLRFHFSMLRFYRVNMLPEVTPVLRPFAYLGATAALSLRAGFFITRILFDEVSRRRSKRAK